MARGLPAHVERRTNEPSSGAGDGGKAERGVCRILAKIAFRLIELAQLEKYKK
jgi:hypothetical protein